MDKPKLAMRALQFETRRAKKRQHRTPVPKTLQGRSPKYRGPLNSSRTISHNAVSPTTLARAPEKSSTQGVRMSEDENG